MHRSVDDGVSRNIGRDHDHWYSQSKPVKSEAFFSHPCIEAGWIGRSGWRWRDVIVATAMFVIGDDQ
jgi:hypothetical protein